MRSAIVLSLVGNDKEDGFLQMREILGLKLNCELVVLSACQTGWGQMIRGEGLIGLTRAFLYAGSASVVASLWNVNDRSTADFMTRFYYYLQARGQTKAAALRQTKLDMLNDARYPHPYYWAPFLLMGEAEGRIAPSEFFGGQIYIFGLSLLAAVILMEMFWRRKRSYND